MTNKMIENTLAKAKRPDGRYDGKLIIEMNKLGIYFSFSKEGVRWKREKFE